MKPKSVKCSEIFQIFIKLKVITNGIVWSLYHYLACSRFSIDFESTKQPFWLAYQSVIMKILETGEEMSQRLLRK